MPGAIPKGLIASHVRKAIKDIDGGIKHPFGKQKRYSVVHDGKRYAPKAIVGLAYRHYRGRILKPSEFSGGIQPGQANYVLQELGFHVADSHDGGSDVLSSQLSEALEDLMTEGYFKAATLEDERDRVVREIVERRGQPEFRAKLIAAFKARCAITSCDAAAALEAAHIMPYLGPKSNHVSNGLPLRSDVHTLFDLDLIGTNPTSFGGGDRRTVEGNVLSEVSRNEDIATRYRRNAA